MNTVSSSRKNIQKLQRAIVDGLEDVKAVDIRVFDTEALSPLFERVVIASGASSRQTKALAASVIDAVRDAGFPKPRTEGEANGEWIIIDCAQAVVHVMQPQIRQYYHLEELWGDKPVRLKLGAARPLPKAAAEPAGAAQTPRAARAAQPAQPVQAVGVAARTNRARTTRAAVPAKPVKAGGPAKPVKAGPAAKAPKVVKTVVVPASSRRRSAPATRAASAAGRPASRAKP